MASRKMAGLLVSALALVLLAGSALAGNAREARQQAESSLRVSGSLVVGPDGEVESHELDPKAPLTPALKAFVDDSIRGWRFKPVLVDGKPVRAKVPMSLRLVAKRADDGKFSVTIASTYFGSEDDLATTDRLRSIRLSPPRFPKGALMMGGKGVVYLVVQVGRDGKVTNVDAEQVNLRVAGTEGQMASLRKQFTDAAVRAARGWTFTIPTTGPEANDATWLVRVPVDYRLEDERQRGNGWDTYIPGPRNFGMPWASEKLRMAGSPDALPDDGVFPLQQGATLLNPPAS